ncbi:ATP-binding protein [Paralysiella testudinis]|uniref:Chemotaxis protein CheA n=1 Tax=Paralysiella testudinis TaxID=2809020 RepID=A0A892ZQN2_9NEIS|nr:ATP-binding protein [Paralysiella testudinis]QRQ83099.1 Hpt domain-containing protein [Paralysiella testudinis]
MQQISKNLSDINLLAQRDFSQDGSVDVTALKAETYQQFNELTHAKDLFGNTLTVFDQGGSIADASGNQVQIGAIDIASAQKNVALTKELWAPFLGLMDNFTTGYKNNNLQLDNIQFAADYARIYNSRISGEMTSLATALGQRAQNQANFVRLVQVVGIVFALAIFLFIVFRALRQLFQADSALADARQETEEIMATINEGLFLVAPDLTIGSQYSSQLENIIGQRDLGGKNFADVLAQFVPKEDLEITQTFIEQLYSDWVVEDLIEDLNPLHRIRADIDDPNSGLTTKYLDFKFSRVYRGDKIERVLVSVSDTSQSVLLQRNLEEQREQSDREIEMLSTVINADPAILHDFITGSQQRIQVINETLKRPEQNQRAMQEKARYIAREIHSLKGESSAMNLHRMVNTCEIFEDELRQLRKKSTLTGQDFIGLAVLLEDLYKLTDVLAGYSKRVGNTFNRPVSKPGHNSNTPQSGSREQYFRNFAADIGRRNHKQIEMSCVGLDDGILSTAQQNSIKDIVIQLLRNAIVHGIETPEIRQQRGKAAQGKVSLSLSRNADNTVTLIAEDDGNGINFDAIRLKAAASGQFSAAQANNLSKQQLLGLMFSSGFSTANETSEDAGKGVGMDIIKTTVHELGGKLKVSSSAEEYTRFSIILPQATKS